MGKRQINLNPQRGMMLIMLVFMLGIAAVAYMVHALNGNTVKIERDKKTAAALAEAKAALISYSTRDLSPGTCTTNCLRPGDLPCPDMNNTGVVGTSCGSAAGSSQTLRIGRLPWKTLGIGDLRDGYGERLWYAVSNRYKYNTRYRPLNSDTTGTITLRNSSGAVINDGSSSTGLVAVIFSPGPPIVRQDGVQQDRSTSQENVASNYLDIAVGEDNASFTDGSGTDGFIMGPIKDVNGNEILNDRLLPITRNDMIPAMEARVLSEVANALLDYFCGIGNANYATKSCNGLEGNFPNPASFSSTTCLGSNDLTVPSSNCISDTSVSHGRIPVNGISPAWSSTSILRGVRNGNWFQQNGWRELIHYAVAPACATGTSECNGAGWLTLNNALLPPIGSKRVVLIAAGRALSGQSRANNTDWTSETNYLEDENLLPLDNTYTRISPISSTIDDRAVSIP